MPVLSEPDNFGSGLAAPRARPARVEPVRDTHTTASDTVMEAISIFATAPLQPWDAITCTSQAAGDTLAGVLDEWGNYLESRLGAPAGAGCDASVL
jgi:hypothetical protein